MSITKAQFLIKGANVQVCSYFSLALSNDKIQRSRKACQNQHALMRITATISTMVKSMCSDRHCGSCVSSQKCGSTSQEPRDKLASTFQRICLNSCLDFSLKTCTIQKDPDLTDV